jgi:beta-aspartyl-peptidase (threonine type)
MTKPVAIAIHGGAGTILKSLLSPELELEYVSALTTAVNKGYDVLSRGGSSLQAVEASVISLEDCPLFNAGRGAVFNSVGGHEMDAAIMEGAELRCGAISSVQRVKNPVSLAKMVMEKSEHVFLGGEGAVEFGKHAWNRLYG